MPRSDPSDVVTVDFITISDRGGLDESWRMLEQPVRSALKRLTIIIKCFFMSNYAVYVKFKQKATGPAIAVPM